MRIAAASTLTPSGRRVENPWRLLHRGGIHPAKNKVTPSTAAPARRPDSHKQISRSPFKYGSDGDVISLLQTKIQWRDWIKEEMEHFSQIIKEKTMGAANIQRKANVVLVGFVTQDFTRTTASHHRTETPAICKCFFYCSFYLAKKKTLSLV